MYGARFLLPPIYYPSSLSPVPTSPHLLPLSPKSCTNPPIYYPSPLSPVPTSPHLLPLSPKSCTNLPPHLLPLSPKSCTNLRCSITVHSNVAVVTSLALAAAEDVTLSKVGELDVRRLPVFRA